MDRNFLFVTRKYLFEGQHKVGIFFGWSVVLKRMGMVRG
jgi:hypothetical protein